MRSQNGSWGIPSILEADYLPHTKLNEVSMKKSNVLLRDLGLTREDLNFYQLVALGMLDELDQMGVSIDDFKARLVELLKAKDSL